MQVRTAVVDDAPAIAEVHVAAWRQAYVDIIPASYLDGMDVGKRTEQWAAAIRGDGDDAKELTVLVVEVDGVVCGFADVGEYRDARAPEHGELWALYVHPSHWRGGAGGALMEAALTQLRTDGRSRAYLWVLTENDAARAFYERWGWYYDADTPSKWFDVEGTRVNEVAYRINL